jgi:hypothetical protein
MPSIGVAPDVTAAPGGGPVIGGYAFPRPNGREEPTEPLRNVLVLASGSTRAYDQGVRQVYSFSWVRMRGEDLDTLRTVTRSPYVTLQVEGGAEEVVVSTEDGVSASAVPGTYPVRYTVSLNLKGRDAIR